MANSIIAAAALALAAMGCSAGVIASADGAIAVSMERQYALRASATTAAQAILDTERRRLGGTGLPASARRRSAGVGHLDAGAIAVRAPPMRERSAAVAEPRSVALIILGLTLIAAPRPTRADALLYWNRRDRHRGRGD